MDTCVQKIATIDTYLVSQANYQGSAYKELLQFLQASTYAQPGGING
jgi:hypothetical protein